MRRAVAIVLLASTLASCSRGRSAPAAYTLTVDGTATVSTGRTLATGAHQLKVGDTVTVTSGRATLTLPRRGSLELRAGKSNSVVRVAEAPTLVDGDGLLESGSLRSGAATFTVPGAARIRRSSGVTIGVYRGDATIDALGSRLVTPALRQAAVSDTGALPRQPVPLVYDRLRPDPWDVRELGDAIDLGTQLDRRARALTVEVSPPVTTAAVVATIVPQLRSAPGFADVLIDGTRSVGETVVGASITLAAPGDFVRRWNDSFTFRQQGADWGLVALDQRASRAAVIGVLDSALERAPARFGPSRPAGPAPTTTTTVGPGRPGSTTTTTTTTPSRPTITVPPAPTIPPTTVPSPLDQLLGGILGAVGGRS